MTTAAPQSTPPPQEPTRHDPPRGAAQGRVQEILDEVTACGEETGVQVAAYLDGELVVDAWAGVADLASGRPLDGETLMPSWSTGKGVAAALVAVLVEREVLDYDAPLADSWPEFGCQGKQRITLGQVLSHSAGLPQLPAGCTPEQLLDLPALTAWLAAQPPRWEPGSSSGYHGWTYGVLLAELLRRATGRDCAQLLREEVAGPLGVADSLLFAVPDRLLPRLATCYDGGWAARLQGMPDGSPFFDFAPRPVLPVAELANRADFRRTALPANGTMTARAAARMYAALVGDGPRTGGDPGGDGPGGDGPSGDGPSGGRLVSEATVRIATTPRTTGRDRLLGIPLAKGYGFMLSGGAGSPVRSPDGGFGTSGSGGSTACADPARRFSFALTKNRMSVNRLDERLVTEVRAALGLTTTEPA
ncbi:serine hydrolase domain-containing protein [Kitasatospora nipponensis]|uniref:Serine hydrolase domain-containing protein n=1 Tax=Kitasatospora nipponensis TaxID=258049 RepID=A0ABN1X1G1_9ACTN